MQLKGKKKKGDLCSVWWRCCDWSKVSEGFGEVCDRDFSLDDTPQSGRPTEVDSETLIESNHHHTMGKRADILKICQSSAENHLHH